MELFLSSLHGQQMRSGIFWKYLWFRELGLLLGGPLPGRGGEVKVCGSSLGCAGGAVPPAGAALSVGSGAFGRGRGPVLGGPGWCGVGPGRGLGGKRTNRVENKLSVDVFLKKAHFNKSFNMCEK